MEKHSITQRLKNMLCDPDGDVSLNCSEEDGKIIQGLIEEVQKMELKTQKRTEDLRHCLTISYSQEVGSHLVEIPGHAIWFDGGLDACVSILKQPRYGFSLAPQTQK